MIYLVVIFFFRGTLFIRGLCISSQFSFYIVVYFPPIPDFPRKFKNPPKIFHISHSSSLFAKKKKNLGNLAKKKKDSGACTGGNYTLPTIFQKKKKRGKKGGTVVSLIASSPSLTHQPPFCYRGEEGIFIGGGFFLPLSSPPPHPFQLSTGPLTEIG